MGEEERWPFSNRGHLIATEGWDHSCWAKATVTTHESALGCKDRLYDFGGTLRPYQQRGLSWLSFLGRLGVGAILADDMGLGKTVQILGLLAALAQVGPLPTTYTGRVLIAGPKSLEAQWKAAAESFVPGITFQVVTGTTLNAAAKRAPKEYPQVEYVSVSSR